MTTPELIEYIKNELSYGRSREIIAGKLKIEGWADGDIIEAFDIVAKASVPVSDSTPIAETQSSVLDNKIVGNIYAASPAIEPTRPKKILKYIMIPLIVIVLLACIAVAYRSDLFSPVIKMFSGLKGVPEQSSDQLSNSQDKLPLSENTQQQNQGLSDSNNSYTPNQDIVIQNNIPENNLSSDSSGSVSNTETVVENTNTESLENFTTPVVTKEMEQDESKSSIIDSMMASAELYFNSNNNSYKGFCTTKGEYGAYQLAITLPNNSIYKCNDYEKAWSANVKLSTGKSWCSDSTGYHSFLTNSQKSLTCSSN